jgi:LPXTG-motif cell wall-anchored protein
MVVGGGLPSAHSRKAPPVNPSYPDPLIVARTAEERKARRIQHLYQAITALVVLIMIVVLFATIAHAGKIKAECVNGGPVVSWAPDFPEFSGSVTLDGPDGTDTGLPVSGSFVGRPGATYTAHFINGADGIEWGTAVVTTPPACTPPVTIPAAPAPAALTALVVDTAVPPAVSTPVGIPAPTPAPPVTTVPQVVTEGGSGELPATGGNTDLLLLAGTLIVAAGVSLLILRRPRTVAD